MTGIPEANELKKKKKKEFVLIFLHKNSTGISSREHKYSIN